MNRVAIYARKSVYVEGSMSVENQVEFCKEYINKKYKDVQFNLFEDEGFSGSNTNRPQFIQLMTLIQLKKIDTVVCYKIDRIARNIVDFVNVFNQFQENNVVLISITEGFDPSTPIGKMLMMFLASFAEMERMNIQQRVRDNNLALAKRGKWSGGSTPLGYRQGNKTLELDNVDVIKEIFKMKSNRKNLSEIIDYINVKYSNFISSKSVLLQLLRKTIYVKSSNLVNDYLTKNDYKVVGEADGIHGYLRYKDKESGTFYMCVASDVEGIVDDSTWLQVQMIADENNKRENSRFSENFWLTKTLRCPICGGTYMGQTKKNLNYSYEYYMCRDMGKGKYKTCTNTKRVKREFIEELVEDYIISLKSKENFDEIYSYMNKSNNDDRLIKISKEIKRLNKQIEQLTEKITFASIKVAKVLMEKQDKLLINKEILEDEKNQLEFENIKTKNEQINKNVVYESILKFDKDLSTDQKRQLIMNIFQSLVYDPLNQKIMTYFY